MRIIVPNADFSARNLGNVSYYRNVLDKMGITAGSTVGVAFTNFLNSFETAGFRNDFSHAYLFGGGQNADAIDIISLLDAYKVVFFNDNLGLHTQDGFQPDPVSPYRNGNVPFVPNSLTNFHCHHYINTQETESYTLTPVLGGFYNNNTGGGNFQVLLTVSNSSGLNRPRFACGQTGNTSCIASTAITTLTGLFSGWKVGTSKFLFGNNIQLATVTETTTETFNNQTWNYGIGGLGVIATTTTGATNRSGARQRFAGWGNSAWNSTKEAQLKAMLDTLESAI